MPEKRTYITRPKGLVDVFGSHRSGWDIVQNVTKLVCHACYFCDIDMDKTKAKNQVQNSNTEDEVDITRQFFFFSSRVKHRCRDRAKHPMTSDNRVKRYGSGSGRGDEAEAAETAPSCAHFLRWGKR